jgi:hypothetical protein
MKFIGEDHPQNVTVHGPCFLVLQIFITNLWSLTNMLANILT